VSCNIATTANTAAATRKPVWDEFIVYLAFGKGPLSFILHGRPNL
jgi:hypothetical protein